MQVEKSLYELNQSLIVWFGRFASVRAFGLSFSQEDHSMFCRQHQGKSLLLILYVDDIIITGDNAHGIADMKYYLNKNFQTNDLGSLWYLLGIKIDSLRRKLLFFKENICLICYLRHVCWGSGLLMHL